MTQVVEGVAAAPGFLRWRSTVTARVKKVPELTALGEMGTIQATIRYGKTFSPATGRWVHPADPVDVAAGRVRPAAVSGRGTVFAYTVNEQQYHPDVPPPYVIALVQLDEQEDLRLPTNVVGCDPAEVHVGMRVEVVFERHGDIHVPLFRPVAPG